MIAPDRWVQATEMTALAVALKRLGGSIKITFEDLTSLRGQIHFSESPYDKSYTITLIGDSHDEIQVK